MKREDILAMDPTELRIEVAEKVFHAKVIGKEGSEPPQYLLVGDKGSGWKPLSGKKWQNADWHFSEESAWNDCPEYGESISAAWDVVEQFPTVNLSRIEIYERNYHHAVEIFADADKNEPSRVEAKTAPEAICKAALLAVLEESP